MLKVLIFCLASSVFTMTAYAQTVPQEKASAKGTPQTTKPKPKEAEEKSIDLDAFFKKGEENAKTSSCDKPAEPAEPVA